MYTFADDVMKISVRSLVEFICRSGSLDSRRGQSSDKDAMEAGRKAHRKIQNQMGSQYSAEVPMKMEFPCGEYRIVLEGRADGVITEEDLITIDEIKGTYRDLHYMKEPVPVHKAQAMCYAYMKCAMDNLSRIGVMMTYVNLDTEEIKYFTEVFGFKELKEWFDSVIGSFKRFSDYLYESRIERDASIKTLEFPFEYREGQKKLAVSVYRTVDMGSTLFIQAPTGVGKTISCIYPAVKAMGEKKAEKIFYLTAKTITRTVAEETYTLLRNKGLFFSTVTITAKEKICLNEECQCDPVHCPFADGHFDRVNEAIYDIITHERGIDRNIIEQYSAKHNVCPFEFALDVTYWVDGIICDYNYVFDPNVYLKRFFTDGMKSDYVFLVDESHNLVDRAREMYSAVLYKDTFLKVKKLVEGEDRRLFNALNRCNRDMLEMKRECDDVCILESIGSLSVSLTRLFDEINRFLEEKKDFEYTKELLDLFFDVRHFLNMHDLLDENYVVYTEHTSEGFMIKLFCVNPAKNLKLCLDKGRATVFFSATLLPIMYYKELLGSKEDYAIYAHSPFDTSKRKLLIASDVTSRYTRRNETEFLKIKKYIDCIVTAKKGNYMVFFPSYSYMDNVYRLYDDDDSLHTFIHPQGRGMNEMEREEYLSMFIQGNECCIGFCVTGGIFSEGIDLKNDSLIGCIIVGTGIPQICTERQLLRDFYDKLQGEGYDYAYTYPGMNKVMQAAGRVIRTHEDIGIIALLDDRFLRNEYQRMFPVEWEDYSVVNINSVGKEAKNFWDSILSKQV